ncbi:MAG: hypothetical protein KAH32_07680 [Chlamydiia bacterium]|nr:hypothetical protein [Chlamydiia bacterium]
MKEYITTVYFNHNDLDNGSLISYTHKGNHITEKIKVIGEDRKGWYAIMQNNKIRFNQIEALVVGAIC